MKKGRDVKPDTRLVAAGRRPEWTQGIVNPAVWRASTILFDDIAAMEAAEPVRDGTLHYGRNGTPTTWALQEAITGLEQGAALTRIYPSGSAAVAAALLSVLAAGGDQPGARLDVPALLHPAAPCALGVAGSAPHSLQLPS
jgi:cystathionine beta-lyase